MHRKPEKDENIALSKSKEFQKNIGTHRSLKDVLAQRQKIAEDEGTTFATRHFLAVSLLEEGVAPDKTAITDDWKKSR